MADKKFDRTTYCKYLRAKNSYGLMEGGDNPWTMLDQANMICWCIKTGGMSAPDSGYVSPQKCKGGRKCFEAPTK
jgi:hypothetical protein